MNRDIVERPLCNSVKLNPRMSWRTKNVRDARAVECLLRRDANREWNKPKRKKCVAVNKAEQSWRSEESFDIRLGDAEFGVHPAGCGLALVPISSLCFLLYVLKQ